MTRANLYVPVTARRGSIAIGNFDGVHRGHAEMLQRLKQMAIATASHAVAVTFDPHPIAILRPEFTPPILTTLSERITLLKESGADEVVVLPVTQQLLEMTAEQFFTEVIVEQFEARGIVEGPNFHFGKDRHGDTLLLQSLCDTHGIQCHVVKPVVDGDLMISDSRTVVQPRDDSGDRTPRAPLSPLGSCKAGRTARTDDWISNRQSHRYPHASAGSRRLRGPNAIGRTVVSCRCQHRTQSHVW